jgi:c-di-GMP-binding flagellar brake protein YcgR
MNYSGAEKRRFIRTKFPCKITIRTPKEHSISTYTENISAGGIRVTIEEQLQIATIVDLEVYLREKSVTCRGRIVWVVDKESPYRKGIAYCDTGIEFYEITDQDRKTINELVEKITGSQNDLREN